MPHWLISFSSRDFHRNIGVQPAGGFGVGGIESLEFGQASFGEYLLLASARRETSLRSRARDSNVKNAVFCDRLSRLRVKTSKSQIENNRRLGLSFASLRPRSAPGSKSLHSTIRCFFARLRPAWCCRSVGSARNLFCRVRFARRAASQKSCQASAVKIFLFIGMRNQVYGQPVPPRP